MVYDALFYLFPVSAFFVFLLVLILKLAFRLLCKHTNKYVNEFNLILKGT
jgi:hypothetical protein